MSVRDKDRRTVRMKRLLSTTDDSNDDNDNDDDDGCIMIVNNMLLLFDAFFCFIFCTFEIWMQAQNKKKEHVRNKELLCKIPIDTQKKVITLVCEQAVNIYRDVTNLLLSVYSVTYRII